MFIRWKRKDQAEAETAIEEKGRLFLHLAESGWSVIVVGEDGQAEPIQSGEAPNFREMEGKRLESTLRMFAATYPKRRLAEIKEIHILLDDATVAFSDAKDPQLRAPSPGTLSEYGCQQLNVKEVAYGERNFGRYARGGRSERAEFVETLIDERKRDIVYAFMDAASLRSCLGLLESTAIKIKRVVPVGDLLLRRVSEKPDATSAALYIAEDNSYLALASLASGTALVRTIPFGLSSIVLKVAESYKISPEEAKAGLESRDRVSGIRLGAEADVSTTRVPLEDEQLLGPILRQYLGILTTTFDFFETQRGAGAVTSVEVFGTLHRINGLKDLLARAFGGKATFSDIPPVEMFRQASDTPFINMLSGASEPLLTVGKTKYSFAKNGFVSAEQLAKESGHIQSEPSSSERSSGRVGRARRKQGSGKKSSGLFGLFGLFGMFGLGSKPEDQNKNSPGVQRQKSAGGGQGGSRDREYFMIGALALTVCSYLAWMVYDSTSTNFINRVDAYSSELSRNARLKTAELRAFSAPFASRVEADKVLWSEKFLAVASHLSPEIWLTDIYLADEIREFDGKKLTAKKLVVEGGILPSTDGHILRIAELIDKLLADNHFMIDFRDISFAGAKTDVSDVEEIVRFVVEAHYEEKKRLEIVASAKKEEQKDQSPIDKTLATVDKRNLEQEKALKAGATKQTGTGTGRISR